MSSSHQPGSLQQIKYDLAVLQELLYVMRTRVAIGVVYAGDPEVPGTVVQRTANIRPWKSYRKVAEDIAQALTNLGFQHVATLAEGPEFQEALTSRRFQLFWINTAGLQGRSPMGHAASQLESLGYPYVGPSPAQATLLDDKVLMKQWLRGINLPTAPFIVRAGGFSKHVSASQPDFIREFGHGYSGPYLVKPALGRGSVDVHYNETLEEVNRAVTEISGRTNDRVVIEPFLAGQEYCVWAARGISIKSQAIAAWQQLQVFGHAERIFPALREKIYVKREPALDLIDPSRALPEREQPVRDDLTYIARTIFLGMALHAPIRLDLRLGQDGLLSVLEVNPKPDLRRVGAQESNLLSIALQDLQITYDDFILKILADWLDFHRRFSPALLGMLTPLFERYAPEAAALPGPAPARVRR